MEVAILTTTFSAASDENFDWENNSPKILGKPTLYNVHNRSYEHINTSESKMPLMMKMCS